MTEFQTAELTPEDSKPVNEGRQKPILQTVLQTLQRWRRGRDALYICLTNILQPASGGLTLYSRAVILETLTEDREGTLLYLGDPGFDPEDTPDLSSRHGARTHGFVMLWRLRLEDFEVSIRGQESGRTLVFQRGETCIPKPRFRALKAPRRPGSSVAAQIPAKPLKELVESMFSPVSVFRLTCREESGDFRRSTADLSSS